MVSRSVAERLHVFAYEVSGSGRSELITIAMSDPTDLSAVDQLAFHTGKRIKPMLAGDTEVLGAIQQYYGGEKPAEGATAPTQPGGRPFIDGAKAPGASARGTPIAPMAAVAAAAAAPTTPRHPPAPAPPPVAEPEPAAAEPTPEALEMEGGDLPADAPMDGLEPIAAHVQGEMNVDGAEGIAPPDSDAASADEPVPLEDRSALQGWAEGSPGGGEPTVSPSSPAADELPMDAIMGTADVFEQPGAAPIADAPDAWSDITDPLAAQTEPAADESNDAPAPAVAESGEEALQETGEASESDPAWAEAAAAIEAAAKESELSEQADETAAEAQAGDGVQADDATENEPAGDGAVQADYATENEPAPASAGVASFLESPDDSPAVAEELSIDPSGWADESAEQGASGGEGEEAFSMSSPAEEPPSDAEASFDVDTQDGGGAELDGYGEDQQITATQRHGWLLRQKDQAEVGGEGGDESEQQQGYEQGDPAAHESHEQQQGDEQPESYDPQENYHLEDGHDLQEGTDPVSVDEPDQSGALASQESFDQEGAADQPQGEQEESIELATDEGWTAPPEEDAQGAWFGDALSSTTPLSPADLGTLAALGLDPADAAAAQRMLACLVRVLNRRQAIDLEELAAEIRESQLASDAAAQTQAEGDPEAPAAAADDAPQPSGTDEDDWTGSHDS
jgi:hypothetical protein